MNPFHLFSPIGSWFDITLSILLVHVFSIEELFAAKSIVYDSVQSHNYIFTLATLHVTSYMVSVSL